MEKRGVTGWGHGQVWLLGGHLEMGRRFDQGCQPMLIGRPARADGTSYCPGPVEIVTNSGCWPADRNVGHGAVHIYPLRLPTARSCFLLPWAAFAHCRSLGCCPKLIAVAYGTWLMLLAVPFFMLLDHMCHTAAKNHTPFDYTSESQRMGVGLGERCGYDRDQVAPWDV